MPRITSLLATLFAAMTLHIAPTHAELSPTEKKPVSDEYHGVKVTENYRWLENSADPAVKAWSDAQTRHTRAYLDALPDRAATKAQLTEWYAKVSPSYGSVVSRSGRLFALKFQPPKQQRLLVALASAHDLSSEQTVLDPNVLTPKGQVSIDWFVPSQDGKLVAVCLSENGSEEGTLHLYKTDTGEALPDRIPRVQYPTGGGSAAWTQDCKAIFYTRYPHAGERPEEDLNFYQQIYFHRLGSPENTDVYSAGKDFPRIAEIHLHTSRDGRWLLASVANGDGGEYAHFVRDLGAGEGAEWRHFARFEDGVKAAEFSADGVALYLRSVKDAPRGKILRLPLDGAELKDATLVVPESDAVIQSLAPTASFLFAAELIGGPSRVRRFDLAGNDAREIPLPANSGAGALVPLEDNATGDRMLFLRASWTEPSAWYLHDPAENGLAGSTTKTALANTSPVDFSDIEAVREFATAKDGAKIPVNIPPQRHEARRQQSHAAHRLRRLLDQPYTGLRPHAPRLVRPRRHLRRREPAGRRRIRRSVAPRG